MKLKKIVLILLLTLALFSISSVSAQNIDVNTTNNINPLNEVLIDETILASMIPFDDIEPITLERNGSFNELIKDIKDRGVAIEWFNGKQTGIKKNDSDETLATGLVGIS